MQGFSNLRQLETRSRVDKVFDAVKIAWDVFRTHPLLQVKLLQ